METITIIGTLAALFTTVANLPQAYKIIKQKSTKGISPITYSILLTGTTLWVVYGILGNDWPIIISNGISSMISIIILIFMAIPDHKIEKLHDNVM